MNSTHGRIHAEDFSIFTNTNKQCKVRKINKLKFIRNNLHRKTTVAIRTTVNKNPYPHDRRADKDSYPHDSNNQCIILRLQLSFVVINQQMMLV